MITTSSLSSVIGILIVGHSGLDTMAACSTELTNLITYERFYLCVTRVHHLYATYAENRILH